MVNPMAGNVKEYKSIINEVLISSGMDTDSVFMTNVREYSD